MTNYQKRPTGSITVSSKTNTSPIITSKTITNFVMVSIVFFFQHYMLQMPVKGAKGLEIAAATLTGRSYPCLIGYWPNIWFKYPLNLSFWPPFCYRWHSLYNLFNKKNIWTSQPLQKWTMVFIVKLLNFLLRDFWMLETIKSIRQWY